jgi:hypothetical protein
MQDALIVQSLCAGVHVEGVEEPGAGECSAMASVIGHRAEGWRGRPAWIAWLCSGLVLASTGGAGAASPGDDLQLHVANSAQALQRFADTRSLGDLRTAVDEMGFALNPDAFTAQTFVAQRRVLVRGWAKVIKTIELSYDPTYDPHDPSNAPQWGLPDPQLIHDPQARQLAIAALAENERRVKRAAYYHDLTIIDLGAQAHLRMSLALLRRIAPAGTPPDAVALDGILQDAAISSARRAKIDALFSASPGP